MTKSMTRVSPVLGVRRVRQAAEYYRDVYGFTLDPVDGVFQPSPDEPDGVYGIVKFGRVWIHFQIRRNAKSLNNRERLERDVYVEVEDVSTLYADVKRRGANIIQEPFDAHYGFREFTVEDLNGFRLAFGQLLWRDDVNFG